MVLELDSNLKVVADRVREFIREEVVPLEDLLLNQDFEELLPVLADKREMVKKLGLWAPHLPPAWGGMGLSLFQFGHLSECLAWSPLGHYVFNCQAPDIGNTEILIEYGTPEQQERFLRPLINGEIRSCFAMTEPEHAGSNPLNMSTTAEKDGSDYVINGHKWFTSSADGASFTIVMAITHPEVKSPYTRASQIIVPLDTPGYRLIRNIPVMGEAGQDYFSHGEVEFRGCRVPRSNLLGGEGDGFRIAQQRLGPGRIHHCMRWIGISERALDLMCRRAASRELAPGRLLGSRQTVQNWIAESRAEIDSSRYMVLATAEKIDQHGSYAARQDISKIKFHVAGVMLRILDRAIQVHGGLGVTDDTILAYLFRHERAARIYDGPDEVHKVSLARSILKQYGANIPR